MDNARRMEKAARKRDELKRYRRQRLNVPKPNHDTHVIGPGWTLDINWQDSSKRVGNPKTSRKERDAAVTLAPRVSKDGQSKEKGKSDTCKILESFPRFKDQSHTEGVRTQPGRTRFTWLHIIYESDSFGDYCNVPLPFHNYSVVPKLMSREVLRYD